MNELTKENCAQLLDAFVIKYKLTIPKIAKAIGCPKSSLERIILVKSWPTELMLKHVAILLEVGFKNFNRISKNNRDKLFEKLSALGGGVFGFSSVSAAISAAAAPGLTGGAVITSGLAGLGGLIGGGMAYGIGIIAVTPIITGYAGYKGVNSINTLIKRRKLNSTSLDPIWESPNKLLDNNKQSDS